MYPMFRHLKQKSYVNFKHSLKLICRIQSCEISKSVSTDLKTDPKSVVMNRILNVAEKNDAAKSLADIMSRGRYNKREGFSKFNKIYEFPFNILNSNCTMTMTSVSGHLLGLEFTGQYRSWNGCNPVMLFEAPVLKHCPQDYVDIKRTLEREVRGCQALIIWTDCDREGENIGFEIIQVCTAVKPGLKIYRARFSEITPQAIQRAINNLVAPDINTSDAVDIRQELDLRIGAAFTRFQTLRLKRVFPDVLADQLISYGSCQFPTLGFVVERYKQVQEFVPEPFWKIRVVCECEEGEVDFTWKRQRLFDYLACQILYEHCLERPEATVVNVSSKPKSKWRPTALDTVELEKNASRKLRINAKETMKIAEKLYTQGLISYPRTETNIFPKEFDLRSLISFQTGDAAWGGFAQGLLDRGPTPRNGNKSDQAHPPIHPTKYTNNLQGNEKTIYEFIVRHFLACCSQDAQGQETTVEIDIHDERFSVSGLMILARNYLEVYPYDKWTAKIIPTFHVGDVFLPKSIEMNQSETSPPSLLTEADLIALMEKHGIGTDATHADHIETIKSRLYVGVRPDGKFVPGELGMGLVEGYDAMGYEMSKPHLRAELEADLKKICLGQKDKNVVLAEQIQKYKEVFIEACRQASKIDTALSQFFGNARPVEDSNVESSMVNSSPLCSCPLCGQDMVIKSKKDGAGFYVSCMGFPDCRSAVWFPSSVLEAIVDESICDVCQPNQLHRIKFKFKPGSVPPFIPNNYLSCIGGCDQMLNETLDIKFPKSSAGRSNVSNDSGFVSGSNASNVSNSFNSNNSFSGNSVRPNNNNRDNSRQFRSRDAVVRPQQSTMVRPNGARPGIMPSNNNRGGGAGRPSNRNPDEMGGNAVVCLCGEDARLLTVKKEGPNTGRQFYGCQRPPETKCNFFLWADSTNENNVADGNTRTAQYGSTSTFDSTNYRSSQSRNDYPGGFSSQQSPSDDLQCGCGMPAKLKTVQKEGPNKGRQFHGCAKPMGQGCNFFQWSDADPADSGSTNFGPGTSNNNGFPRPKPKTFFTKTKQNTDQTVKKSRKCGLCGEEGHTKKTCPEKR